VVLAVLASACAQADDGATQGAHASARTTRSAPPSSVVPTKAGAIAYIDAACQRFFSLDPLNPEAATNGELRTKARQRVAAIEEASRALEVVPLPSADRELAVKTSQALQVAKSAVEQLVDLPADAGAVAAPDYELMRASQEALTELAIALIDYGAQRCVPATADQPEPPPPDAGELIDVTPVAVVPVTDVLGNNALVEADTTGAFIGLLRRREVVKISATGNEVEWRAPTGDAGPEALAVADEVLWVRTRSSLQGLDAASGKTLRSVDLPPYRSADGSFFGIVAAKNRVWECRGPEVRAIDVDREVTVWTTAVGGRCTAMSDAGDDLVVVVAGEGVENERVRLAKADGRVAARSDVATSVASTNASVDLSSAVVYLAVRGGPVTVDLESLDVRATAARGGGQPNASCLGAGALWYVMEGERRIVRYEPESGSLKEFLAGPGANELACTESTLWVTNSDAGTVSRYEIVPWGGAG
jgi:hypothetical protein